MLTGIPTGCVRGWIGQDCRNTRLMARRRRDDDFDQRLDWDIIVDANGPEEQALGWYHYLENHRQVPFDARCVVARPMSPLPVGDGVEVRGLPSEEVGEHEMFVNIAWQERLLCAVSSIEGPDC